MTDNFQPKLILSQQTFSVTTPIPRIARILDSEKKMLYTQIAVWDYTDDLTNAKFPHLRKYWQKFA